MSNSNNRSNTVTATPVIEAVTATPVIEAVTATPVIEAVTATPVIETVSDDIDQADRDRYNSALQKANDLADIKHEKMLIGYYAKEIATVKFNRDRAIFSAQFARDLQALQKSVNNRK